MSESNYKLSEVYSERNYLAIVAAKLAIKAGYNAGWQIDNNDNWGEQWRMTVIIDGNNGQVSYHMSPSEYELAKKELPEYKGKWDGTFKSRSKECIFIVKL